MSTLQSAIKLTLLAKETRARSEAALRADPIAIIGMSCRVPGGGNTPEQFWNLLRDGVDAVREVPADRWDGDAWMDPEPFTPSKAITKSGGFLDEIDRFDADYFDISSSEAERMDPQQRLALEVAIEAIDDAGLPRHNLEGSKAGVFFASYHNDYTQLQYSDLDSIDTRTLTGTLHSVLANRLSYFLDLRGPSISIDTACSSSLVAVHLACQSLRLGETNVSVAGGVSLMVTPDLMVSMSKVGFMAPDGRCKTFDAQANGFGRGEGCGVVVLKRLSDAIAADDRILGVIRGSAVNQDGHSTLLAAPRGPAQEALIREAIQSAQIEPGQIGFVEAHGTGTALGDPIEVEAIAATLGAPAAGTGPCYIGSAKANLGHLEAAAGVVGLIKTILMLRHGAIPPQVHFSNLSPHISFAGTRLAVPTSLIPWEEPGNQLRCASVSSFGVGGTNAHVIVEEPPKVLAAKPNEVVEDAARLLPLSARSQSALRALIASWIDFLYGSSASVADLTYTAARRRTHFASRIAAVGRTKDDLIAGLRDKLELTVGDGEERSPRPAGERPRVAFVFCGQGPQWFGMGRELLATEPAFRGALEECDQLLEPLAGWSLLEELRRPEEQSRLNQTRFAQPALFALQVALAALWKERGISPDAVIGHSVGEIAALHIAGVLDLPEAIRVVFHRGLIMQRATGGGRMASISVSDSEIQSELQLFAGRVSVAAVNAPRSIVLSGETDALADLLAMLELRGIGHRMLHVDYAFHSAQMNELSQELVEALGRVNSWPATLPIYSTLTGTTARHLRFDAEYFARNVREPVRFAEAMAALCKDGCELVVEIGPQPVLAEAIGSCCADKAQQPVIVASLRRGRPEQETLLRGLATAWEAGCDVRWDKIVAGNGRIVDLPAYPWQRKRHWLQSASSVGDPAKREARSLLGKRVSVAGTRMEIFEGGSADGHDWLADHRIRGEAILPATVILEIFRQAASALFVSAEPIIETVSILRSLVLNDTARWQVVANRSDDGSLTLELHEFVAGSTWRQTASAVARPGEIGKHHSTAGRSRTDEVIRASVYSGFNDLGVEFGPAFRCLNDIRRGDNTAEATLDCPDGIHAAEYPGLHPVILDAGLQLCSVAAADSTAGALSNALFLPVGVERFWLQTGRHRDLKVVAELVPTPSTDTLSATVSFFNSDNDVVGIIGGVRFVRTDGAATEETNHIYNVEWLPAAGLALGMPSAKGEWLVFADKGGLADTLVDQLEAAGAICSMVSIGSDFARMDEASWRVDPAEPQHYRRVVQQGGWGVQKPLRGVIFCWGVDSTTVGTHSPGMADDLICSGAALHVVQALSVLEQGVGGLWFVTRGAHVVTGDERPDRLAPAAAGLLALARVVAIEHPRLNVRAIDLDSSRDTDRIDLLSEFLESSDFAVALRGTTRRVPRLQPYSSVGKIKEVHQDLSARIVRPGVLDGVELVPVVPNPLQPDEIRLETLACGLNFRDVLLTLGMYPDGDAPPLGAECAGVVNEVGSAVSNFKVGDQVFGYAPASMGNTAVVREDFVTHCPDNVAPIDAAGIPVAFLTAMYGLRQLANLRPGERVLIHAAAGGVGLAAVQVARQLGAEVFATAGSEAKRDYLRSIGVTHVMDSRSLDFADQILAATDNAGVHVVLNSLTGEFVTASLKALAQGGRFLELGKRDIWSTDQLESVRPDVSYTAYDLGAEAFARPGLLRPMLDELRQKLADGSLHPLPIKRFELSEIGEAMRYMAQAQHIGKIVFEVQKAGASLKNKPFGIDSEGTYWITGGLGNLGLETAGWLVEQGARHLVLTGRHAPSDTAKVHISDLEARGATVRTFEVDAADRQQMTVVADEVRQSLPPLRGIIHAAGVLRDGILLNQTWESAQEVLRAKVEGAWVLHELTKDQQLDFFVLYSAAGAILGAGGQGLYPAANAELDAIADVRRQMGLPALSVAWGNWNGRGMAQNADNSWASRGLREITPATGFRDLERLLASGVTYAAAIPIDWAKFLSQASEGLDRSFFDAVKPTRVEAPVESRGKGSTIVERLRATPLSLRRQLLVTHLIERALHVLGKGPSTMVEPDLPLKDVGLDSLTAVELCNNLSRSGGRPLPATLLFDYPTINALTDYLAKVWRVDIDVAVNPVPPQVTVPAEHSLVAQLSEKEAEALLLRELDLVAMESRR